MDDRRAMRHAGRMKRARKPVANVGNIKPDHRESLRGVVPMDGAAWLRKNDPNYRRDQTNKRRADQNAVEQAKRNPALVAHYRKALIKKR